MRHPIWKKDDVFYVVNKTITMDPSGVVLPEVSPLTWNYDWNRPPIGKVTEIRLEDDEITGEVEVYNEVDRQYIEPDAMEEFSIRLFGFYNHVIYNDEGTAVIGADLRGVSLAMMASGANPGAKV